MIKLTKYLLFLTLFIKNAIFFCIIHQKALPLHPKSVSRMKKYTDLHYMPVTSRDEQWGIICTTAGHQTISPGEPYPPTDKHPHDYVFKKAVGRTLNEYQLVYIVEGEGWFESAHCPRTDVKAGTVMMLFPGEWHNYAPDPKTGWKEYWIGFNGRYIDERVENGFFSPERPLVVIGNDIQVEEFYLEVLREAQFEKKNFQLLISSVVLHLLGTIVFRQNMTQYESTDIADKIEASKQFMRKHIEDEYPPERVARELGMGYSWFRRMFKEYVGVSPAQYQLQLRYLRARDLLKGSDMTITEIAYELGFSSGNQFSTFFSKHSGMSPRQFRQQE